MSPASFADARCTAAPVTALDLASAGPPPRPWPCLAARGRRPVPRGPDRHADASRSCAASARPACGCRASGQTALITSTSNSVLVISAAPCGDLLGLFEQTARALRRRVAEEPPDRRVTRDHVRLVAAVGDHAMRAHRSAACARDIAPSQCPSARRASSASRPFQGAVPACAVSPWKVKVAEISADCMSP